MPIRHDLVVTTLCVALGALVRLEIEVIGRLFLTEIGLALAFPVLLERRGRLLLRQLPRRTLILGGLWLLSQMVTDLYRSTSFEDWARGWAKISVLLLNISSLYLLTSGRPWRLVAVVTGFGLGLSAAFFIKPTGYAIGDPWKFGIGWPTTILAAIAAQAPAIARRPSLVLLLLGSLGLLSVFLGSRALGAVTLATAVIAYLGSRRRAIGTGHPGSSRRRSASSLKLALLTVFTMVALHLGYGHAATQGWLGEAARTKYEVQSSGNLGLLVGGRTEIFASVEAVGDSPLLGHGSWAKNPKYGLALIDRLYQHGYTIPPHDSEALIPTHSYVFGAWVEAGLLGAFFWCWVGFIVARAVLVVPRLPGVHAMTALLGVNLLWSIPFSPFGADARLYAAAGIVAAFDVIERHSRRMGFTPVLSKNP